MLRILPMAKLRLINIKHTAFAIVGVVVESLPGCAPSAAAVITVERGKNETSWLLSLFNVKVTPLFPSFGEFESCEGPVMSTEPDKESFSLKRHRGNVNLPCLILCARVSLVITGATVVAAAFRPSKSNGRVYTVLFMDVKVNVRGRVQGKRVSVKFELNRFTREKQNKKVEFTKYTLIQ